MTQTHAPETFPDPDMVEDLAAELLRALTPHAGSPEAVRATLLQYLDLLDVNLLAFACFKALQLIFADCLTPTPLDQAPPGAPFLTAPEGDTTS